MAPAELSPLTGRDQRYQTMDEVQAALSQAATTPVKKAPSIAVLPFASLSADAEKSSSAMASQRRSSTRWDR